MSPPRLSYCHAVSASREIRYQVPENVRNNKEWCYRFNDRFNDRFLDRRPAHKMN